MFSGPPGAARKKVGSAGTASGNKWGKWEEQERRVGIKNKWGKWERILGGNIQIGRESVKQMVPNIVIYFQFQAIVNVLEYSQQLIY